MVFRSILTIGILTGSLFAQDVAAVENTAPSPRGADRTRGASAAGPQYGWQRARLLVPREGQGPVCGAFECVLQIARSPVIIRGVLAQPTRTAVYGSRLRRVHRQIRRRGTAR